MKARDNIVKYLLKSVITSNRIHTATQITNLRTSCLARINGLHFSYIFGPGPGWHPAKHMSFFSIALLQTNLSEPANTVYYTTVYPF